MQSFVGVMQDWEERHGTLKCENQYCILMLLQDISSIYPSHRIRQAWHTASMLPHISFDDLAAWLRLSTEPGIGPIQIHRFLPHFESPHALYASTGDALRARLPPALALQLSTAPDQARRSQIDAALAWLQHADHHLLTLSDPRYPALLKEIPDHPAVLYAQGDLARLQCEAIAIVGARNATADGRDNATAFARHLSGQGWCVVSGLAHGIDAAAHAGALCPAPGAGGTIAVLGTGIDVTYPSSHRALTHSILSQQGLLISEFHLGAPPLARHFPRRNRIVAGLSRGVLVVQAARKSGSLITARLAADMGREVFAIPGSIHAPLSRGPHALIQQGAKLVETGEDILSELSHFRPPATAHAANTAGTHPPAQATRHTTRPSTRVQPGQHLLEKCSQSPLWDAIGYDSITEETLQRRSNMLPTLLQTELLMLELSGCIERQPNGMLARTPHATRRNTSH